ncbi:endopeptidase La [Brevibacillus laterosporus]|uniref:endopeptidase La n=1 Tax=Brevibacillus laterosporus TaxID=1465 RepID=UPI000368C319|nr:endopeptidase La [Brevibacillus laterosporus]ATO50535.1 endopeptidase La [Brevibacillus laterosporus DSM 25]AYB39268.1 endopeptidase La [Brevibacillus laterosporus]MBG9771540.1 DNA-binding protein [Brevibacillus laterosporus]MBG9796274.1 DNA-binding protein [Brevibacillus laterosporus]MBG9802609.1 DNA-binding protein [Brevibacillus laterosporus]
MSEHTGSREIPLLPLRGLLVYPSMVLHLDVGREKSVRALERAMVDDNYILLSTQEDVQVEEPDAEQIYSVGTVARVKQMLKLPNGTIRVLVEGLERASINEYLQKDDYYYVSITYLPETRENENEIEAMVRTVLQQFEQYIKISKKVSPETLSSVSDIEEAGRMADVITSHLPLKMKDKQDVLEAIDVHRRLEILLNILNNEREVLELERRIGQRVKKQMEKTQKEYYLREQMKAIQKELGERDGRNGEMDDLREQLDQSDAPERIKVKLEKELDRLDKMPATSAESSVVRTYIDTMLSLPWTKKTEDNLDIAHAEAILDEDHYGLEKPKERILEYLAVQKLVSEMKGPILCLVGPPGVGKTSLGRSIARAMGREFIRISLGGVRDEAEIRGHRRTYVGAMPGRIIQSMRQAGTVNPVILLDEIDKLASDFRGDPASALLEVLDPNQNEKFSDHYVEEAYDLSNVIFLTTANTLHTIPRPLLDRMETIEIAGYTELEKFHIMQDYLLPKNIKSHGITKEKLQVADEAMMKVIRQYTREAGVRNLNREAANLCRKAAKIIVSGEKKRVIITPKTLENLLGKPRFRYGLAEKEDQVGSVTGLAWTQVGGDTLNVEVSVYPGKGTLTLTGQLGDVMKESAQAALSYIRSRASQWDITQDFLEKNDIHIHVPEGAIPKDGPSAGITMATALLSAMTNIPVRKEVGMTGEITLRGRVLPIGGLKEKVLSAHRAGLTTIILPIENEKDLEDIPDSVKNDMTFHPVEHMDDVIKYALVQEKMVKKK